MTHEEIDLVELINEYRLGDLWYQAFELGLYNEQSDSDKQQIDRIGNQLMTSPAYESYKTLSDNLE